MKCQYRRSFNAPYLVPITAWRKSFCDWQKSRNEIKIPFVWTNCWCPLLLLSLFTHNAEQLEFQQRIYILSSHKLEMWVLFLLEYIKWSHKHTNRMWTIYQIWVVQASSQQMRANQHTVCDEWEWTLNDECQRRELKNGYDSLSACVCALWPFHF